MGIFFPSGISNHALRRYFLKISYEFVIVSKASLKYSIGENMTGAGKCISTRSIHELTV